MGNCDRFTIIDRSHSISLRVSKLHTTTNIFENNGEISKTLNEYPILPVKTRITRIPSFFCNA